MPNYLYSINAIIYLCLIKIILNAKINFYFYAYSVSGMLIWAIRYFK